MHKSVTFLVSIFLLIAANLFSQDKQSSDPDALNYRNDIVVEKGQTLLDYLNPDQLKDQQTDIDPGVAPEGDFMLRSAFTQDGSKVLVCTGGTNNLTVFDYETMEAEAVIEVGTYPCDVATTDDYAIVPCIFGDEIYVIDLLDYTTAAVFSTPAGAQPCVVEVSPDGNYAYIACDINDQCEVIDLQNLTQLTPIVDFPISLITFSWVSTGGRSTFKFSRFAVSQDGNHLIVGNADNDVLFVDPLSGTIDYNVSGIPNCYVTSLSGDGTKTVALSDFNNIFQAFQIDNSSHTISASVELTGNYMATYDVAVNPDGTKAFVGIGNNSSAIVRFQSSDFITFSQTYTPFWMGTSPDHQYAVSGQYRFSIMDFENETMIDQLQGYTQDFGCISPVANKVVGYDPLRYEGAYFFDFETPNDIQYNGRTLAGLPPEADTPYRIAISEDGTKAITSNSLSESASIIDLTDYSVAAVLDLGEKSDAIGITHDSQWAIMGGYDLNTIKIIDLVNEELAGTLYTGQRPLMVAIAPDDAYAYIGNLKQNSVSFVELDGAASTEIVEIPTGVIGLSWAAYGVRSSVEVDPTGQYVLVAASFADQVQVIDIAQQQIVANLNVGTFPLKIAFNETGEYACVTNYNSDSYSIIHVDGAASSVVGTFPAGDGPLRLAYNPVDDEFGIINYSTKTVINVNPETGTINSTDYYTQYGNPIQIYYDTEGNPIVLALSNNNDPGYLIRKNEAIVLPATPTYFDYCAATNTAVVCMPGPDYVTVVEYDQAVAPMADFGANITTIQVGESVVFEDLSLNSPNSWDWTFEGGTPMTSSEQNPEISYETEGTYDVSLTVSNGAGSDEETKADYITVLPLTYVFENNNEKLVTIGPNPVNGTLYLKQQSEQPIQLVATVFDSQGKLLFSERMNQSIKTISFADLDDGLYVLKVTSGGSYQSFKIVKKAE
ncbi:MAG TPA: PKD domain-containing protein [Bacteroidales bacterium]|nr:PKD domain-containing protein [Bacteroidales bacterium]HRX98082.1 PKD domain-containing protein [Bacteroidales bacterium]